MWKPGNKCFVSGSTKLKFSILQSVRLRPNHKFTTPGPVDSVLMTNFTDSAESLRKYEIFGILIPNADW